MYLSWRGILYAEEIIEIFLNLRPIASRQTVFTKSDEIYLRDSAGYSVDGNRELKRFPRLNGRASWHRAYYQARAVSPLGKKEELTEEGMGWAGGEGNENSKGRADQRAAATDREPADLTENLFRAFSASTIRALPDRILSSVSWIHSGNRMEGKRTRPRRPKFISSNSFHVTVKGKSPSRADVVLWKNHEGGGWERERLTGSTLQIPIAFVISAIVLLYAQQLVRRLYRGWVNKNCHVKWLDYGCLCNYRKFEGKKYRR